MNESPKKTTSKYLIWFSVIALAIAAALVFVVYLQPSDSVDQSTSTESNVAVDQTVEAQDTVVYTAKPGSSALSQLQEINDSVVVKESEMGSYVDSINGLVGGTDGKYWSFYVNDEMPSIGAGQFMPEGGEEIKWHFVKL